MYSNSRHDELEPRMVPRPSQFQEISAKPEVPELSVVFETSESVSKSSSGNLSYAATSQTTRETYNEWKNRQNHLPTHHKETHYYNEQTRDKQYYGSSSYNDCDQNPYNRFSDRMPYKLTGNEYHKCACQNTPTVKDIYNMMQVQNDQMKFLLETIQKLLVTVLSNQQVQHKCCCFEKHHCKNGGDLKKTELLTKEVVEDCQKYDNQPEKPQISLQNNEILQKKNETNKRSKDVTKSNITPMTKDKVTNPKVSKCDSGTNDKDKIEKERTYSIASDESFELNSNDVHVTETPISPEQSIHIEMASSEDSSNSECEEENNKKIEVGWTMYKNIIGQVNNLLEDNKNELKSEAAKPVECVKSTPPSNPKNFEERKHFMLPENNKIDSSLQMQALAMQYLSPEQAVKFDMNKHFVPTPQPTMNSPNNYSISTLHYMERYHLIAPEKNNSENPQQKSITEWSSNKKKKSSRKNKPPSKILNITELKQQPKLS